MRYATAPTLVAAMLGAVLFVALLPAMPVAGQPTCSVPNVQSHRGIQGTFDQCLDRTFVDGGTTYTVHVYYTETTNASDAAVCAADADGDGMPDRAPEACEHALTNNDNAAGENLDAVMVAEEAIRAWQFYRDLPRPVTIVSGTELTVYIGEDGRGGGIPTPTSLWWDDDGWIDGGDRLGARLLAFHESFHLAQTYQYPHSTGSHGEGVARALEDRVDAGLDADLGHLFIPDWSRHLALEGPSVPDAMGNLPAPRARGDALDVQWYWSLAWWTWVFDRAQSPGDVDPVRSWDAIDELYDLMASNATDVGAVHDLLAPHGLTFEEAFRRYGQSLFTYPWNPTDPQLGYPDAEITTATGPMVGHLVRPGDPPVQTDSFTMNPRSNRYIEYRPNAACEAVTFSFDGNGQSYGWATLGVDEPNLVTQAEAVGTSWSATVLAGEHNRIAGVVTSTGASGTVDVDSGCVEPTLRIEDPTTTTPAAVGEAADPDRLLVRVDVDGPDGDPVQGLRAADFAAQLRDGLFQPAATVLSSAQVQSDYWLLLELPDQADGVADGDTYDLAVELGSIEDVETAAVSYAARPDRDLLVITDHSGSMSTSDKIEAARNAGELLVEEMTHDDRAGYVAFNHLAAVREPLAGLGGGTHRDDVQTAIRAESPGGLTSVGAGAVLAAAEHDDHGAAGNDCAFVLLSDGAENTDPRWSQVMADVADNGCPLHVVALGPGANEPLLQQIAASVPGGSYDYAGTGPAGGAFAQAGGATTWQNGLAAIYDLAATRIGDRERLRSVGFNDPPPAIACTDEVVNVDFSDASPTTLSTGEQMTAGGVTFDGLLFADGQDGDAEVTDGDEVLFNHLTLETDVPACQVVLQVRMFGATAELRVNGDSRTFSNLSEIDGVTVGGITVEVQNQGTVGGFQTGAIVLEGPLVSYGLGGTRTFSQEFAEQVYLSNVLIQRGEPAGIDIQVDPTSERLVVTATSQTPVPGALSQLYRPDGTPQPTSSASREPHGSSEVWQVTAPQPGRWRLAINEAFTAPGLVTASAVTDLTLELLLEPTDELVDAAATGVEVPIVVVFSGQTGPVLGADVIATVTDPSGFATPLRLHDDGNHGDGAPDDGFYGGSYTATTFGDVTVADPGEGEEPPIGGSYRVDVVGVNGADRREDSGAFALRQGTDSDGDGTPNNWELEHGLDPNDPSDATGDPDRDGLGSACEFEAGTDPRARDTDGGGAADSAEVAGGERCRPGPTNPLDGEDDPISPIDSLHAEPLLDPDGLPIVELTWGDPLEEGDELVDVDLWCRPLARGSLQPAEPWGLIATDVTGHTFTLRDVADGEYVRCQIDPRVDGGGGPREGTTQTSPPVPVSDDPYPPEGTVVIDDGAPTTADVLVDLELTVDDLSRPGHGGPDTADIVGPVNGSAPGDIEMRLANGAVVPDGTPWRPYERELTGWELDPDSSGLATVTVQYRDAAGNVGAGGLQMTDTIQVASRRLAGPTRVETAVEISQSLFPAGGADAVVVARSDIFPDALAGGPLAVARRAPVLLTPSDALHPATAAEIQRVLLPGAPVYVLGGTAAITEGTAAEIVALGNDVRRVSGPTRIETAIAIAEELGEPDALLLANGYDFPDPLISGAVAPGVNGAVLLVGDGTREPPTDVYLQSRPEARVYAVGGPAVAGYPEATPLAGATPDETAVVVAEHFLDRPTVIGLARNDDFPDALAGGAHVARGGGAVLLTPREVLSDPPAAYLCALQTTLQHVVVYGGTAAITDAVAADAAARARGIGC